MSSTENISLKLTFPDWDNISADKKSFINYILEDAIAQFRAVEDDGSFVGFTGNIVDSFFTCHIKETGDSSTNSFTVYSSPFGSILFLEQSELNVGDNEVLGNIFIGDSVCSEIKKTNTFFTLYDVYEADYEYFALPFLRYDDELESEVPVISERVVITPVIDGVEIDDRSFKPSLFGGDTPSEDDEAYYKTVRVVKNADNVCEYSLRTSSFGIYDIVNNVEDHVYYKVGLLVPSLNGTTLESVINVIKENFLFFCFPCKTYGNGNRIKFCVCDAEQWDVERETFTSERLDEYIDDSMNQKLPLRITLPCDVNKVDIICYMKLYYEDGRPYDKDTTIEYSYSFNLCVKVNGDSNYNYVSRRFLLSLTDQSLDGGFIPAPSQMLPGEDLI